ncbi:MAG: hypothetical protein LLF94_00745 [Chlamydiales bacterium]|nr:hypothetical protein [Chlamydiales bacterium]
MIQRFISFAVFGTLCLTSSCQHTTHEDSSSVKKGAVVPLVAQERELNPYGSFFTAERMPDTYIENVGPVATYRFVARKFPQDQVYVLASQSLGGTPQPIAGYEVDDDGHLGRQIEAGTLMLDNEMILMFDYFKGEPVEYWLCSNDATSRLGTSFVPYPISTEAKDGAIITVRRLTQDAGLVLLEGTDFNPDEEIAVGSQVGNMRTPNVPIRCRNGRFSMIFEPKDNDKSGGTAYIDVLRKGERLMLEYDWGCEAVNPKRRQGNTSRIKHDALINLPTDL